MGWVAPDDKKTQHKNLGTEYHTRLKRNCLQRFVQVKHEYHAKKGLPTNVSWGSVKKRLRGQPTEESTLANIDLLIQVSASYYHALADAHALLEHDPAAEIYAKPTKATLKPTLQRP